MLPPQEIKVLVGQAPVTQSPLRLPSHLLVLAAAAVSCPHLFHLQLTFPGSLAQDQIRRANSGFRRRRRALTSSSGTQIRSCLLNLYLLRKGLVRILVLFQSRCSFATSGSSLSDGGGHRRHRIRSWAARLLGTSLLQSSRPRRTGTDRSSNSRGAPSRKESAYRAGSVRSPGPNSPRRLMCLVALSRISSARSRAGWHGHGLPPIALPLAPGNQGTTCHQGNGFPGDTCCRP